MFKNKLIITIISAIFLISCLCISICAYDYTYSEPSIDGYTVVTSEIKEVYCNFYSNSFYYMYREYSKGSDIKTTCDFQIDFMMFQSDFTDSYFDFGGWLNDNSIEEVTPLTWKEYVLYRETAIHDIYFTIDTSTTAYGNIEQTLNSYSNCAYLLYYIAHLEINADEYENQIDSLTSENSELQSQIDELQRENSELEAEVGNLAASNQTLANNYDTLYQAYGELELENASLREQLTVQNGELQSQIDELQRENSELEAEVGNLAASNQTLANNYDTLYQAYGELEAENSELEAENASLREQLNDFDGYEDGYNQALNDTSAFKKGILFIMSSPVVIFSNMFNYDIFGINLFNIIQVLFTILVVSFAFGLIFKYIL